MKPVRCSESTIIRPYRTKFISHGELAPTICTLLFCRTFLPSG